jgi:hypothetical protein
MEVESRAASGRASDAGAGLAALEAAVDELCRALRDYLASGSAAVVPIHGRG